MLYLFAGDDAKTKRKAYEEFIKSVEKDTERFFVSRNNFNKMELESFYSGAGLFFKKCAVFLENILEYEEQGDFVLDKLDLMSSSANDFIFLESKLNKSILDEFKKARADINVFEVPKEKKEKYDNFILTHDLEMRNKFNLWLHFREAMDIGVGMEELVGVLFWKAKDMILKKNFSKFSEQELQNFATRISYVLPEARKSGRDDEAAFEAFLLESF